MGETEKLGKYTIQDTLGQGAMGIVYRGYDPLIDRTVALKTIRKDAFPPDNLKKILARFTREAQAAGRLNHPGIVTVYEYGEDEKTAFIAMEYVKGRELKDFLDHKERFPLDTIISIIQQLLEALAYSHSKGVIHRDIKPGNIIVLSDGKIKVTDFGIARIESSSLTQFGDILGTPSYMSPEQFMGHKVDNRTDLFSTGVILYHLLTGEKPFPGNSMTTIMHRVLNTDPPKMSDLNFQVPMALDFVVYKALAKNAADRYQSAEELSTALADGVRGDGPQGQQIESESTLFLSGQQKLNDPLQFSKTVLTGPESTRQRDYNRVRRWILTLSIITLLSASGCAVWKIYTDKLSREDIEFIINKKAEDIIVLLTGKEPGEKYKNITGNFKHRPDQKPETKPPAPADGKQPSE